MVTRNINTTSQTMMPDGIGVLRKIIASIICLPVLYHIYVFFYFAFTGDLAAKDLAGLALINLVADNFPYIVLGSYTIFLKRLTPKNISLLWPLLIILLGIVSISLSGIFYHHVFSQRLNEHSHIFTGMILAAVHNDFSILTKQSCAAIGVVILSNFIVLINLFIKKLMTLEDKNLWD